MAILSVAAFPSLARAERAVEPPITYLSPPEFQSTAVVKGGFDVTFTCPSYPSGRAGDYRVRFAARSERDPDGRLSIEGYFGGEAGVVPGPQPGTCASHLQLPLTPFPPSLTSAVSPGRSAAPAPVVRTAGKSDRSTG